jgi:hypothetical protein
VRSRFFPFFFGLVSLAAAVEACGGGITTTTLNAGTATTPAPASMQTTLSVPAGGSSTTNYTLPAVAGIAATLSLPPITGVSGTTNLNVTVSTRAPSGVPTPPGTTYAYATFTLPAGAVLNGIPHLFLSLPSQYGNVAMQSVLIGNLAVNVTPLSVARQAARAHPMGIENLGMLWDVSCDWFSSEPQCATPTPSPTSTPNNGEGPPLALPVMVTIGSGSTTVAGTLAAVLTLSPSEPITLQPGQQQTIALTYPAADTLTEGWSSDTQSCISAGGPIAAFSPLPLSTPFFVGGFNVLNYEAQTQAWNVTAANPPSPITCNYFVTTGQNPGAVIYFSIGFAGAAPSPSPSPTPQATLAASVTFFPFANDWGTTTSPAVLPTPPSGTGFSFADLSAPGVTAAPSLTITSSVGNTNFAPSVFGSNLPAGATSALEYVEMQFSQGFTFATTSGISYDFCFPQSLITASSYTFSYYNAGTKFGSAAATMTTNDGTCAGATNVHLSADSSSWSGQAVRANAGTGILITNP